MRLLCVHVNFFFCNNGECPFLINQCEMTAQGTKGDTHMLMKANTCNKTGGLDIFWVCLSR